MNRPGRRRRREAFGAIAVVLAFALVTAVGGTGCHEEGAGNNNTNECPTPPCNADGVCDIFEDCLWCADCCVDCTVGQGPRHEFIVTRFQAPTTVSEARAVGLDLDGDRVVDNRGGSIASIFSLAWDYNAQIAEYLSRGRFILLLRVDGELPSDERVSVQVFPGDHDPTHDATEDNLTGVGHVLTDPTVDRTDHLCGIADNGRISAGPGRAMVPYPYVGFLGDRPLLIPLEDVRVRSLGTVDASGVTELVIAGGVSEETVQEVIFPAMAAYFNAEIARDPSGDVAFHSLDMLDGNCEPTLSGCDPVPSECTEDGHISDDEMRCNALLSSAFSPDMDIDGDCTRDHLSLGLKVWAVPVTIGE